MQLDRDVAAPYGVETRVINQVVKNNPEKFPAGYVVELSLDEFAILRSKFLIKYLRSLGYRASSNMFKENSWYFRNALVRANYARL